MMHSKLGYDDFIHGELELVFESVQQKHLDKTIFDQQVVNYVQKTSTVPIHTF